MDFETQSNYTPEWKQYNADKDASAWKHDDVTVPDCDF